MRARRSVPDPQGEHSAVTRFLDALYIPEKLRHPLSLMPTLRTKAGNRANLTAVAVEIAEEKRKSILWNKVLLLRNREDEDLTAFFGNCVVVATMLTLLFLAGLGVRGSLTREEVARATNPKVFSMVAKKQSLAAADSTRPAVIDDSVVKHNDLGQVVEVRAADPRSVLVGYCRALTGKLCDPLELALSDPPNPQLRFGVYRGFQETHAIRIRRDPGTGRWVAGDGKHEIHEYLARSLRMSGNRVIVEDRY